MERKLVTAYEEKGHQVNIRLMKPDLLVEVDGMELSPFYLNVTAAREGATREIERIENVKAHDATKARKVKENKHA